MASGQPVLGDEGECLGAVVSRVDITAMKVLDRLKSKFVAKVSHFIAHLRIPSTAEYRCLKYPVQAFHPRSRVFLGIVIGAGVEKGVF